jgi:hypothetical protein
MACGIYVALNTLVGVLSIDIDPIEEGVRKDLQSLYRVRVVDMQSLHECGIASHFAHALMNLSIDKVQLPRFRNSDDFASEITMESAYLRDNALVRQALKKNGSIGQHDALTKVIFAELGSRLYQTLAPEAFLVRRLQLNMIPKLPRHPGTQGSHHAKPFGSELGEPALTTREAMIHFSPPGR